MSKPIYKVLSLILSFLKELHYVFLNRKLFATIILNVLFK